MKETWAIGYDGAERVSGKSDVPTAVDNESR